jgi:uncharacterized repeat protein (TIGR03847 family)
MDNESVDLGLVDRLEAESFGEPGNRTFRLVARTSDGKGAVSLWLEKEQLVMLGSALEQLLDRVNPHDGIQPESDAPGHFHGELEARVGSMSVGYDESLGGFELQAADLVSDTGITAIRVLARRSDIEETKEQIEAIVAAGRPRCVLCGRPMGDQPHFCPESNGHAEVRTSLQ